MPLIITSPSLVGQEQAARSPRNASYDIDVRLDHAARTLAGRATIRWRNISSRPATELQFHLYWNAWRNNDSTWLRERKLTGARDPRPGSFGSIDISALRVRARNGAWVDAKPRAQFIAPDDGNKDDRTVLRVPLDQPVPPGGGVEVNVEWTAKVPQPFARTGYVGDYYFIAQWFPKLGVLEDQGWNTHQFHSATEFFADYGVYNVAITVPTGFVVGATGCSTDPAPPATPAVRHVPGQGQRRRHHHASLPRRGRARLRLDGQPRHHRPDADVPAPHAALRAGAAAAAARAARAGGALLRHRGRHAAALRRVVRRLSLRLRHRGRSGVPEPERRHGVSDASSPAAARWLAPATVQTPEMTTAHEAGHQWWYGMVGSNEFEHAWMDEGLNTLRHRSRDGRSRSRRTTSSSASSARFIPWAITGVTFGRLDNDRLAGYRDNAEADIQSTPTWRYWPSTATFISYNKTALWLHTLERQLGWPTVQKILATYFERWKFRHPKPEDFFAVVNEVSGTGPDVVLRPGLPQLQHLRLRRPGSAQRPAAGGRVSHHAWSCGGTGEATFPVEVVTTFDGGAEATERWDGLDRRVVFQYERPERATSAAVDPRRVLLLDANYTNNSRSLSPRSGEASLKWALSWMVWLQQLMLSYGFFA